MNADLFNFIKKNQNLLSDDVNHHLNQNIKLKNINKPMQTSNNKVSSELIVKPEQKPKYLIEMEDMNSKSKLMST